MSMLPSSATARRSTSWMMLWAEGVAGAGAAPPLPTRIAIDASAAASSPAISSSVIGPRGLDAARAAIELTYFTVTVTGGTSR
ncbi:MAG TPA: hypothetical protein VFV20_07450 [Candidatus Limnocylindria bacterium]|nr:hypothetical protein [Candidatus Limnocylindria bacterium]